RAGGSCVTPIKAGQIINAALTADDCSSARSTPVDRYVFTASAGERVAITVSSFGFEGDIYLAGPGNFSSGTPYPSADRFLTRLPQFTNDFLVLPQSGTYVFEVAAKYYSSSKTGSYQVALTVTPGLCNSYLLASDKSYFNAEGGSGSVQVISD